MSIEQFNSLTLEQKQAFRFAHNGHWSGLFAAFAESVHLDWPQTVHRADCALVALLNAVPQLALPADIEPHGYPEFPHTNASEAAPDGPIVNEERASSPREHPAALSALVAAADHARRYLFNCSDLLDGMGCEAGCGNTVRHLETALAPFTDADSVTQPDTAVS